MTLHVDIAGRTHLGLVRRRNEDALYVGQSLAAVADGLGGHPAGDQASAIVIDALQPFDRQTDTADLPAAMGRAVKSANDTLRARIEAQPELSGMGSTLVALLWSDTSAVLANVGDSRAYLLRDSDTASQITEDHTFGHLIAEAADVPDLPGRLSRWLDGRADGRSPDLSTWDLRPGDRFMLCSDGLSSFVPFELINAALVSPGEPGEAADQLITLAIDHGAPDNVTVVLIDIDRPT